MDNSGFILEMRSFMSLHHTSHELDCQRSLAETFLAVGFSYACDPEEVGHVPNNCGSFHLRAKRKVCRIVSVCEVRREVL